MNYLLCKYCNLELSALSLEEITKFGIHIQYCKNCNAEFFYFINNNKESNPYFKFASTSLYSKIDEKYYRLTMPVCGKYQLWSIKDNADLHTRKYHKIDLILSIKENININPKNVNEKIKKWLAFL